MGGSTSAGTGLIDAGFAGGIPPPIGGALSIA